MGKIHVEQFFDELTGVPVYPELARLAEILHTFPVYEKVEASEDKSKEFISTRWILTYNGDAKRSARDGKHMCRRALDLLSQLQTRSWTYHLHIYIPRVKESCTYGYRTKIARQDTLDSFLRTLHGTRDAASAWDEFSNIAAIDQGYEIGVLELPL